MSKILSYLGPFRATLLGSLLLSVVAVWGQITPNNDGMLYVEAAQLFQSGGVSAATQVFDWIFLSILIGLLANLTGLEAELAAYVLSSVLLAMLGLVLVALTKELCPQATWAAVAVVLVLPALNNYRDFIIREHGSWLFVMLAMWLMIVWHRKKHWSLSIGSQLSIAVAALFRLESLVFLIVPVIWLVWQSKSRENLKHLAQFAVLPAITVVGFIVALIATDKAVLTDRVMLQLGALNFKSQVHTFEQAARTVSDQVGFFLDTKDASRILFVGLLALIPIKFVSNLGVLVLPLLRTSVWSARRIRQAVGTPVFCAFVVYIFVLSALALTLFFMQARFVALLNLFAVPVLAYALYRLWHDWPRMRWVIATVAVIAALANVTSTSPRHLRYLAAAEWLSSQTVDIQKIYFDEPAIGYLLGAGRSNNDSPGFRESRQILETAIADNRFALYVLNSRGRDEALLSWSASNGLTLLAQFHDERNDRVFVFSPVATD